MLTLIAAAILAYTNAAWYWWMGFAVFTVVEFIKFIYYMEEGNNADQKRKENKNDTGSQFIMMDIQNESQQLFGKNTDELDDEEFKELYSFTNEHRGILTNLSAIDKMKWWHYENQENNTQD